MIVFLPKNNAVLALCEDFLFAYKGNEFSYAEVKSISNEDICVTLIGETGFVWSPHEVKIISPTGSHSITLPAPQPLPSLSKIEVINEDGWYFFFNTETMRVWRLHCPDTEWKNNRICGKTDVMEYAIPVLPDVPDNGYWTPYRTEFVNADKLQIDAMGGRLIVNGVSIAEGLSQFRLFLMAYNFSNSYMFWSLVNGKLRVTNLKGEFEEY